MNTLAMVRNLERATLEERKDTLLALSPSDAVFAALWSLSVADSYRESMGRTADRIAALDRYIEVLEEELRTLQLKQRMVKGRP